MKNPIFYILFLILAASCSPSTRIIGSWTSPDKDTSGYDDLFVAAVVDNVRIRQVVEDEMQSQLNSRNIQSRTSISAIKPDFWSSEDLDKEAIIKIIGESKHDGILTMTLIDQTSEERYVPGAMMGGPMMMGPSWGWRGNFGGYWGMQHGLMMNPGYIVNDRKYFVEINLYDADSEQLVWSGQSKTINPESVDAFAPEFVKIVLNRMEQEGVIGKKQ
jgi:hypothetical protein